MVLEQRIAASWSWVRRGHRRRDCPGVSRRQQHVTAAGRPDQRLDAIGEELGITVTVHLIVIAFRRHREMVRGCN